MHTEGSRLSLKRQRPGLETHFGDKASRNRAFREASARSVDLNNAAHMRSAHSFTSLTAECF